MPWCSISEAATSSWVESGFEEQRTASAPPAARVRIRFAVSAVTCRQALIFQPASGLLSREALADPGQHRHLAVSPFDLQRPRIGQADVANVTLQRWSRGHVILIASRIGRINPQPPERRRPSLSVSRQYSR